MTDEFKEYIKALASMCRDVTGHREYQLQFKWSEIDSSTDSAHDSVKMEIRIDTVYLYCVITVYPQSFIAWEQNDHATLSEFIIHELCHLFIEPVAKLFMWDASSSQRDHYKDTIERQTERISKVIWYLLPKEWYLPEKLKELEYLK